MDRIYTGKTKLSLVFLVEYEYYSAMARSRLTQRIEDQTKRNILITVIGITIILVLLWKFGVPLLATASFMLTGGKEETPTKQKLAYVAPPTLNSTYDATNSAQVTISGISVKNATVELLVNNTKVDSTQSDETGVFSFDSVPLDHGENTIRAQTSVSDVKSELSDSLTITYRNDAPVLSIDSPSDAAQFHKDDKHVDVKGKTDGGVKITVNDFWAIVDTDGNYSYTLPLHDGDNEIKVVATDTAGNKTEKSIKVTYSQ